MTPSSNTIQDTYLEHHVNFHRDHSLFPRTTPPPPLYDTSVSSGTDSSGRMSRSPRNNQDPYNKKNSNSSSSRNNNNINSINIRQQQQQKQPPPLSLSTTTTPELYTQSEPGIVGGEHDRFATYLNRFAELEDVRKNTISPLREDENYPYTTTTTSPSSKLSNSLTAKAIAAASRTHSTYRYNAGTGTTTTKCDIATGTTATSRSSSRSFLSNPMGTEESGVMVGQILQRTSPVRYKDKPYETQSEIGISATTTKTTSPGSGRTRDLAMRLEQRKKQQKQYKQLQQQQQQQQQQQVLTLQTESITSPLQHGLTNPGISNPPNTVSTSATSTTPVIPNKMESRQRPKSLPPVRRRKPLESSWVRLDHPDNEKIERTPTTTTIPTDATTTNCYKRNTSKALGIDTTSASATLVQHGPRATIETPQAANVKALRKKLWTDQERLRAVDGHRDNNNSNNNDYNRNVYRGRADNVRSMSPRTRRDIDFKNKSSTVQDEEVPIFESRYYAAAERGTSRGIESKPKSSTTTPSLPISFKDLSTPSNINTNNDSNVQNADNANNIRSDSKSLDLGLSLSHETNDNMNDEDAIRTEDKNCDTTNINPTAATVDSLIAKLSRISRENPQVALAQIDAILKHETQSMTSATGENISQRSKNDTQDNSNIQANRVETTTQVQASTERNGIVDGIENTNDVKEDDEERDNDEKTISSDDTSVSSITNPTYQGMLQGKVEKSHPASPSHSSGRPTPTSLQEYTKTNNPYLAMQDMTATEKARSKSRISQKKTNQLMQPRPTDSIQLSKGGTGKSDAAISSDVQALNEINAKRCDRLAPKNIGNISNPPAIFSVYSGTEKPEPPNHNSKHGTVDERASEEAPSLRSMGNSTAGLGSIITDDHHQQSTSPDRGTYRTHPWDATVPVRMGRINTKETSMDLADGVETQYEAKYPNAVLSPDRSKIAPVRRMRKERLAQETTTTTDTNAGTDNPGPMVSKSNSFVYDEAVPSFQQEAANTMTDDFDSAWVKLPASHFFNKKIGLSPRGSCQRKAESQTCPSRKEDYLVEEQPDSSKGKYYISQEEVEVEYIPQRPSEFPTFTPKVGNGPKEFDVSGYKQLGDSLGQSEGVVCPVLIDQKESLSKESKSVGNDNKSDVKQSTNEASVQKTKRGLRAFLKRKQNIKSDPAGVPTSSTDQPSARSTYSWRDSFRDVSRTSPSAAPTTTAATITDATSAVRLMTAADMPSLLTDSVDSSEQQTSTYVSKQDELDRLQSQRRQRRMARSPPPSSRSKSLEENRIHHNPKIAQKLSRILRVYEEK